MVLVLEYVMIMDRDVIFFYFSYLSEIEVQGSSTYITESQRFKCVEISKIQDT